MTQVPLPYVGVFVLSLFMTGMIAMCRTERGILKWRRGDQVAVQCAHVHPTSRLGGLAFGATLLGSVLLMPGEIRWTYALFVASALPLMIAGLLEDLGVRVMPKLRLLAGAGASALALLMLQEFWVKRIDFPVLDVLFAVAPVGIVFTVVATAGISHAFNLIDGLNGLAAGHAVLSAVGLIAISTLAGSTAVVPFCVMIIMALAGFLAFNYPWGRIFLGDAGAYAAGHLLAWASIVLVCSDDRIAAWAIILLFFYPIADTFLAIFRRRSRGVAFDQADRLHLHQVVLRSLEIGCLGRGARRISNPLATVCVMPLIIFPIALGIAFWDKPAAAFTAVILLSAFFVLGYMSLVKMAKCRFRRETARRVVLQPAIERRPVASCRSGLTTRTPPPRAWSWTGRKPLDVMQSGLTPLIPLVLLAPLLIRVAYCDLRYMKIPNALSLAALALFIVSSPLIGWEEAGWRVLTAAIVFGLGFVAFAFGLFGGGDVKMLGALLLFIPSQSLTVYAYCFSASMLVGIGVLLLIRALPQSRESNWLGIKSVGAFPMGISIALSGLVFPFVATFPTA